MMAGMPGMGGGGRRGGGPGNGQQQSAAAANQPQAQGQQPQPGTAEARGGGDQPAGGEGRAGRGGGRGFDPNMTPEERQRRMEERMAGMTPEERAQFQARTNQGPGQGRQGGAPPANARQGGIQGTTATTIDALFAPLPPTETRSRVWVWGNGELKAINVRLGISDGTHTELIEGSGLQQGTEIVSNVTTGLEPAARAGQAGQGAPNNPMMPQRGGPGGRGR
jgi:hypothetical protein